MRVWLATALFLFLATGASAQEEPQAEPSAEVEDLAVAEPEPPQEYKKWEVFVGGGFGLPSGDFGERAESGPVFGGGAGYFVTPRAALGFDFNFEKFGQVAFQTNTGDPTVEVTSYQFDTCLHYLFDPQGTTFYLKFMVGWLHIQEEIVAFQALQGIPPVEPEVDGGSNHLHFGQGLGFLLKGFFNLNLFGEGILNAMVDSGGDLWFLNMRGGLVFRY